jgi:uncharacterized membrane protein YfcA
MTLAASLPLGRRLIIFLAADIAGGIANGVAGGGTFLTFPTLVAMGIPALRANVSTSVGVVPSYLSGIRRFRLQLGEHRQLIRSLVPSCVIGSGVGCTLWLLGSPHTFRSVVPWLIGAATILFALAPRITKRLAHIDHTHGVRRWALYVRIFLSSIYGGYFGAGLGIILLAVMAVSLPFEIQELQGIRNVFSMIINSIAALIFIIRGHLALDAVYMLLIGTLIGGWLGTRLIKRLSPKVVHALVVATGVTTTMYLALGKWIID